MPRLDPLALTFGTFTSSYPPVEQRWLDHPFMQWHALTGFPFGRAWREYGHVHPLGDDWSITLAGNMATMPLDRVLDLCGQVPRAMVEHAVYWGTPDEVAPRIIAEVAAGARHFALCNYVGFLSRADAPAATAALLEVVRRVRARFPALAARRPTIG